MTEQNTFLREMGYINVTHLSFLLMNSIMTTAMTLELMTETTPVVMRLAVVIWEADARAGGAAPT